MIIEKFKQGSKLTVKLDGRLDTNTSLDLVEELKDCTDDIDELIFDFEKLNYISSAGLRVLLSTHKKMITHGKMIIKNANDIIMDVFKVTKFINILTIE